MDDIKKRLEFPSPPIQIQVLERLYREVSKRKSEDGRIDSSHPEVPEITLLLDHVSGKDDLVAELAGQTLVRLVKDDVTDFAFTLDSLLVSVPSTRSLRGLVNAVTSLLHLQVLLAEARGQCFQCPFGIRSPTHPLISVLTNRPDAWPTVLENVKTTFHHGDTRIQSNAMELLAPLVLFLQLEPQQSPSYEAARDGMQRLLLDVCKSGPESLARPVTHFLVRLLPRLPIQNGQKSHKSFQLVEDLSRVFIHRLAAQGSEAVDENKQQSDLSWWILASDFLNLALETVILGQRLSLGQSGLLAALIDLCGCCQTINDGDLKLLLLSEILGHPTSLLNPSVITLVQSVVQKIGAPNIVCLASLLGPLLQILAIPRGLSVRTSGQLDPSKGAGSLMLELQQQFKKAVWFVDKPVGSSKHMSPAGYNTRIVRAMLNDIFPKTLDKTDSDILEVDDRSAHLTSWLDCLTSLLDRPEDCAQSLPHLATAILMTSETLEVTKAAIEVMVKVAKLDVTQGPRLLPVMLFVLERNANPQSKLAILEGIPGLATHKLSVSPILKTIQALSSSPDMKAFSLRLMVLLWKQQARTFPHLLSAINEKSTSPPRGLDRLLLSKATAILEVCKQKPEQHGPALLQPLSDIINTASDADNTVTAATALEGLYLLCQAEVIDLRSLWSVLGEKLMHETRPLVVKKICQILSLVPEVSVDTEEYQTFTQEMVAHLWLYSTSPEPTVCAAAYSALANFPAQLFRVSHFPHEISKELHQSAQQIADQSESPDGVSVDELFPSVPGSFYAELLKTLTNERPLEEYKGVLQAMVQQEVRDMPRGVFYSALRRHGISGNQSKEIRLIPSFLQQCYNKCKQPGLRPGLAAGLLFCYDPPVEVGRDGRPRKHYVIRHGKSFLQMFTTLLNEVPVQPSDWHYSVVIPQTWNSFMERLFLSLLEGRKAELDLQLQHGHANEEDLEEKKKLAWMWVRDCILETLKTASKGSPAVQANCVLSLASLGLCVHRFGSDLDPDIIEAGDSSSEFMGHAHWLTVTSDTILSLIDVNYKPKGGLHGLCQQRSTLERSPASTLCTGMARVAAIQLVSVLSATDTEKIVQLLNMFASELPLREKPLTSSTLIFCNGLGLGMLLKALFVEHFSEMTGSKGMLAVWKALSALEEAALAIDVENRSGCVLGVSLAISGLCNEGKTESRAHVSSIFDQLLQLWIKTPSQESIHQSLSVAVTCIAGSMYACNTSVEDIVTPVLENLKKTHQENLQSSGVCLSLGLLTFSLNKLGYTAVSPLRQELLASWTEAITQEDLPPMEKVAKLNGLLALIGSELTLIPVQGSSMTSTGDLDVSRIIHLVTQIVEQHSNLGLQSISAWMLGHLHLSACTANDTRSSVPANFSYLPETSVLRALVDFLHEAGRMGPERVSPTHVSIALECIKMRKALPPLNWAGLLSLFTKPYYGKEVKTFAIEIAACQMGSSATAAMFISSILTPPIFTSLPVSMKVVLHSYMPNIIKAISPAVLKIYFQRSCLPAFTEDNNTSLQLAVLQGLRDALAVEDPPQAVTFILYETLGQLYGVFPDKFEISLLQAMAECMAEVPDEILDSINAGDFSDSSTQILGSFVRCHLVAAGKQPLTLLNHMVDASFNTNFWNHTFGMSLLYHTLATVSKSKSESQSKKQEWLLELLGHSRSVVTGAMPLSETAPSLTEVISIVISIVAVALLTMTYPVLESANLLGNVRQMFTNKSSAKVKPENNRLMRHAEYTMMSSKSNVFTNASSLLPVAVHSLTRDPWTQIAPKMIDWLMTVCLLEGTSFDDRASITDALMMLRHGPDFSPVSVWTKVMALRY